MCSDALLAWRIADAEIVPLAGGTANRNYVVTHEGIRYFLRQRSPRYISTDQIAFDHALMRHLSERGVRGPNPIITKSGDTFVRVGEDVYELHAYLPGEPLDWHNLEHLRVAARSLRRWHEAAESFAPPVRKQWPREDAPGDIRAGLGELREELHEEAQCAVLDTLATWADRIEEKLPDEAFWALPCQVVHGDFHPGNLHVAGDELGLFDLDCASWQPRARDLADGILYLCARRDGPFDASSIERLTRECWLEPARNCVFLDAYGPITPEEQEALPWLVAARWIYSRVRGRIKLPREKWPAYVTEGVLTPLATLIDEGLF